MMITSPPAHQPVKLFHAADYVGDVLDHVHGLQPVEAGVPKGKAWSRSHSTSARLAGLRSMPIAPEAC
jgi:hypothetical protein